MSPDGTAALARFQRRVRDALLRGGNSPPDLAPQRFEIYRHTVQASLAEVLATAFPVTRRVVGARVFAELTTAFIAAAPPQVPHLAAYGAAFPAFIAAGGLTDALPYLADTARLEWARNESYFAADAPPLDAAKLARLSPGEMENTMLTPHPAARLVDSRYPIHRIWQVNQPEIADVPPVDMTRGESVLVTRRDHRVTSRVLTPADAAFVQGCFAGKALGACAAAALETQTAFDLQGALQAHFRGGTFRD